MGGRASCSMFRILCSAIVSTMINFYTMSFRRGWSCTCSTGEGETAVPSQAAEARSVQGAIYLLVEVAADMAGMWKRLGLRFNHPI